MELENIAISLVIPRSLVLGAQRSQVVESIAQRVFSFSGNISWCAAHRGKSWGETKAQDNKQFSCGHDWRILCAMFSLWLSAARNTPKTNPLYSPCESSATIAVVTHVGASYGRTDACTKTFGDRDSTDIRSDWP
jgi:hypothetical protein